MNAEKLKKQLNAPDVQSRLEAIEQLREMIDRGEIPRPVTTTDTNNHVHTIYSFSPYSPSAAVFWAYMSGLCTVGIIDHDSIGGAREFIRAGELLGITTTIGCEVRVSFAKTSLCGKTINNPDEDTVAYIALHGLPHNKIDELELMLSQIRIKRNERNKKQVAALNEILKPYELQIDFEKEVVPISMAHEGGSITERHILFALTKKIIAKYGRGQKLIDFLENDMGIGIGKKREMLLDTDFFAYEYDVLNILKTELVPKFFIAHGKDSLDVAYVVDYARKLGVIPTYCYLGDVGQSTTGDKKEQKFEDGFLDELFDVVKDLGFEAFAYMPSRNTMEQLLRIIKKCKEYELMEISGEDINQPRQSFICKRQRERVFEHLMDSTWALVGHENAATQCAQKSIYSDKTKKAYPHMKDRIEHYKEIGLTYKK
ncbi:MAG: PHP domain-containing protein [Christensenellaceae bacterium]